MALIFINLLSRFIYQFLVINLSSLKSLYNVAIYSYSDSLGGVFEFGVIFLENKPI